MIIIHNMYYTHGTVFILCCEYYLSKHDFLIFFFYATNVELNLFIFILLIFESLKSLEYKYF